MTNENGGRTREKKPTLTKGLFFIFLMIIIMVVLTLAALSRRSKEGPLVAKAPPEAISVSLETVALLDELTLEESFSGIILARRTSQLGFSNGGRVAKLRVDLGDNVKAGQTLAELDVRDLKANLAAAEASVVEAEANARLAEATVERQRTLFLKGHVAQQRVDEVEAQAKAADARIAATRAQADMIRVAIDLSVIRAPFSGVITDRMVDEGAIALPATPMLELVEAAHLEARIGLPANVANRLEVGKTYQLVSDRGEVLSDLRAMTGIIDQNLRTVMSIFDVQDSQPVDIGAVVRLAIPRTINERGFWVPISALSESSRGLWSIYIAQALENGWAAQTRLVEIVHTEGDRAYVRGTVRDKERYILSGLSRLVPGQRILPTDNPSLRSASSPSPGR